jgi:hypothetical protein
MIDEKVLPSDLFSRRGCCVQKILRQDLVQRLWGPFLSETSRSKYYVRRLASLQGFATECAIETLSGASEVRMSRPIS